MRPGCVLQDCLVLRVSVRSRASSFSDSQAGTRKGTDAPLLLFGILSAVLLLGGLGPQYYEIWKFKEVVGLSLIFMTVSRILLLSPSLESVLTTNLSGIADGHDGGRLLHPFVGLQSRFRRTCSGVSRPAAFSSCGRLISKRSSSEKLHRYRRAGRWHLDPRRRAQPKSKPTQTVCGGHRGSSSCDVGGRGLRGVAPPLPSDSRTRCT